MAESQDKTDLVGIDEEELVREGFNSLDDSGAYYLEPREPSILVIVRSGKRGYRISRVRDINDHFYGGPGDDGIPWKVHSLHDLTYFLSHPEDRLGRWKDVAPRIKEMLRTLSRLPAGMNAELEAELLEEIRGYDWLTRTRLEIEYDAAQTARFTGRPYSQD